MLGGGEVKDAASSRSWPEAELLYPVMGRFVKDLARIFGRASRSFLHKKAFCLNLQGELRACRWPLRSDASQQWGR